MIIQELNRWLAAKKLLENWIKQNPKAADAIFRDHLEDGAIRKDAYPDDVVSSMRAAAVALGLPPIIAHHMSYEDYLDIIENEGLPWTIVVRDLVGDTIHYVEGETRVSSVRVLDYSYGMPLDRIPML